MNLPDEPKLSDLSREQLIKLCEHFWFTIQSRDIIQAIYDVEMEKYFKDIKAVETEQANNRYPQNSTYTTFCAYVEKGLVLQKKWDRVSKRFDIIMKWYNKKNKECR